MKRILSIITRVLLIAILAAVLGLLIVATCMYCFPRNDPKPEWTEDLPLTLANTRWVFQESDQSCSVREIFFDNTGMLCVDAETKVPFVRYVDGRWRLVTGMNTDVGMIRYDTQDMHLYLNGNKLVMHQWNDEYVMDREIIWLKEESMDATYAEVPGGNGESKADTESSAVS